MIAGKKYFVFEGELATWIDGYLQALSESGRILSGLNPATGKEYERKIVITKGGKKYSTISSHELTIVNKRGALVRCQITPVKPKEIRDEISTRLPRHLYRRKNYGDGIVLAFVHELVAKNFIPNPEELAFVEHIDENVNNNHYTNLRWTNKPYRDFSYVNQGLN